MFTWTILCGNYINMKSSFAVNASAEEVLPTLPNECVHLTFTSPPYYNARDYVSYNSYKAYLNVMESIFYDVYRVTAEGRFLVVNTSPIIEPRIDRAHKSRRLPIPFDLHSRLDAMGWEFYDDIIWVKPDGSVPNRVGGFDLHRKPLMYRPNCVTEYLMVYRKKTSRLVDWNIKQYSRDETEESLVVEDYERTNVWHICPASDAVHPAVFPDELTRRVISLYSYIGDVVLDPFAGSGTTGRAADRLGRRFIMAEQNATYFARMKELMCGKSLFTEEPVFYDDIASYESREGIAVSAWGIKNEGIC